MHRPPGRDVELHTLVGDGLEAGGAVVGGGMDRAVTTGPDAGVASGTTATPRREQRDRDDGATDQSAHH